VLFRSLGDLSFYHDLNGLLAAKLHGLNATIIVINNDGGGIFSFLPQAAYPDHFEALFGTPTGLDFRPAVEMYGGRWVRPRDWAGFRAAVAEAVAGGASTSSKWRRTGPATSRRTGRGLPRPSRPEGSGWPRWGGAGPGTARCAGRGLPGAAGREGSGGPGGRGPRAVRAGPGRVGHWGPAARNAGPAGTARVIGPGPAAAPAAREPRPEEAQRPDAGGRPRRHLPGAGGGRGTASFAAARFHRHGAHLGAPHAGLVPAVSRGGAGVVGARGNRRAAGSRPLPHGALRGGPVGLAGRAGD